MRLPHEVPVFDANGELIGIVAEVRDDQFRVETSGREGYWLSRGCIETVTVAGIYLSVRGDHLDPYRLTGTGSPERRHP